MTISAAKASTLAFYEANAVAYAQRAAGASLSDLYERFLSLIPEGGSIIDVGCGSGRDLKVFARMGYKASGIDPSPAMVALAAAYSGCPTWIAPAEELNAQGVFDGAWACASLLHLPRSLLNKALVQIEQSLVPGGTLFVSMLPGDEEGPRADGRYFAKYSPDDLKTRISSAGFTVLDLWFTADALVERRPVEWLNVLAKKKEASLAVADRFK